MPVETAADRAAHLDADEFGVEVAYTLAAGGAAVTIAGILDEPSAVVVMGERAGALDARVTLLCQSSDLPAGAGEGDHVAVDGRGFTVANLEPDGQGMTSLTLARE